MTIAELLEAETHGPLTPEQMRKRNERQRRTLAKLRDEQARSAAKVRDLKADLT